MRKVMLLAPECICDCLRDMLDNRYITLPCSDPAAGEEPLHRNPDALILNLCLEGTDGLTFLKANTGLLPSVVIALTPFVSEELLMDLSKYGVTSVLLLPFRIESLGAELPRLLE